MTNILIIGATSAIAAACARQWASRDAQFVLMARNAQKLAAVSDDLRARGAQVTALETDLVAADAHVPTLARAIETLGRVDIALLAHGSLPDQKACEADARLAHEAFLTNAMSPIAILTTLAAVMERQGQGTIAVISSVAGDRGRGSNYVYGAAKSALTTFCAGLRNRLAKSGVHVVTIKPGFVDTPMTQGLPLPRLLVAQADDVARDIVAAVSKRTDILYTPFFWRFIMLIIRMIPERIFKRLSL